MNVLPRHEVKAMILADLARKTRGEFFHDGMRCPTCGYPVKAGDALYIIGGHKCCEDYKTAIVETVKEHL